MYSHSRPRKTAWMRRARACRKGLARSSPASSVLTSPSRAVNAIGAGWRSQAMTSARS